MMDRFPESTPKLCTKKMPPLSFVSTFLKKCLFFKEKLLKFVIRITDNL